jgi:Flp pilus assembly protein TadD
VADLTGQLDILRTRLQVLEAQRVPYTDEELALFQKPEAPLADPRAGRRSTRELPAGTATLVAEAQRDFSAGRFDSAQEKYQHVLSRDDRNATILANLATIQMEMNRLDDADQHVQRAIAAAPDDPHILLILGTLRFRQERLDDALDALSRAGRLDPRNAEIQSALGMVLGEKGMRVSAETALRRAIQLDPHFAKAHHNLAVIYITQKPPAVELARLHYRKAREAGMAANPELEKMLDRN